MVLPVPGAPATSRCWPNRPATSRMGVPGGSGWVGWPGWCSRTPQGWVTSSGCSVSPNSRWATRARERSSTPPIQIRRTRASSSRRICTRRASPSAISARLRPAVLSASRLLVAHHPPHARAKAAAALPMVNRVSGDGSHRVRKTPLTKVATVKVAVVTRPTTIHRPTGPTSVTSIPRPRSQSDDGSPRRSGTVPKDPSLRHTCGTVPGRR